MRVIAHRGDSRHAPENTLAALRQALNSGADGAEIDVRLTRDGVAVLLHDENLRRTTGFQGRLRDHDIARVRTLDAGSWFDARYRAERIPTLAELLALWPADKRLFIEIKEDGGLVDALRRDLRPHRGKDLRLLGFDRPLMRRLAKLPEAWPVHANVEAPRLGREAWFDERLNEALDAGFAGLSFGVDAGWHTEWPARLQAHGLQVAVWTVDDPVHARRLQDSGVDDLMTNDPIAVRSVLD